MRAARRRVVPRRCAAPERRSGPCWRADPLPGASLLTGSLLTRRLAPRANHAPGCSLHGACTATREISGDCAKQIRHRFDAQNAGVAQVEPPGQPELNLGQCAKAGMRVVSNHGRRHRRRRLRPVIAATPRAAAVFMIVSSQFDTQAGSAGHHSRRF